MKFKGTASSIRKIYNGLPQGAILSPILFNIYINDFPIKSIAKESSLLFADDIAYLLSLKYSKEAEKKAQEYLDDLEQWTKRLRLKFAPHKCSQTIFSRARKFDIKEFNMSISAESRYHRMSNQNYLESSSIGV